jgi:hypothetical protein
VRARHTLYSGALKSLLGLDWSRGGCFEAFLRRVTRHSADFHTIMHKMLQIRTRSSSTTEQTEYRQELFQRFKSNPDFQVLHLRSAPFLPRMPCMNIARSSGSTSSREVDDTTICLQGNSRTPEIQGPRKFRTEIQGPRKFKTGNSRMRPFKASRSRNIF